MLNQTVIEEIEKAMEAERVAFARLQNTPMERGCEYGLTMEARMLAEANARDLVFRHRIDLIASAKREAELEKALRNSQDALTFIATAGTLEYAKVLAKEARAANDEALKGQA